MLSFTTMKYIQNYYKKLKYIKTYAHKQLWILHGIILSQEKCKQTKRQY